MENNTKYHFLGVEYNNYKELALALANNYADAINFIYTKEFINEFTGGEFDDFESFIKFRIGTGYAGYAMNYAKRYAQFLYSNYGNEEEVTEEMLQEYLTAYF